MASEAAKAIEAILMVAQEPVDPHLLAQVLEVAPARVAELCDELAAAYQADDRGFVLVKVAGGYRFQSHGDLAPYVERFVLEGQTARLSSAALETLAIVAYKQPISRAQVAAIRGVNVDGVMRTLQQRGYIEEVARDPGPGQATLFGTSREFLERLGLDRIEDLPAIADLFPSADVLEALELGLRAEPAVPDPVTADPVTAEAVTPEPGDEGRWSEGTTGPTPEGSPAAHHGEPVLDLTRVGPAHGGGPDDGPRAGGDGEAGPPEADGTATGAAAGTPDVAPDLDVGVGDDGGPGTGDHDGESDLDLDLPSWFTDDDTPDPEVAGPGPDRKTDATVDPAVDPADGASSDPHGDTDRP